MWESDGARQTATRPFAFKLSPQEAEDIRWYLEDYRIYPLEQEVIETLKLLERLESDLRATSPPS